MSYEDKHHIRETIIRLSREINPKVKFDTSNYNILATLKKRKWSYLDIIDNTRKAVEAINAIPGMKEMTTEDGEYSFQFRGQGVDVSVNSGREGVSIFLCESEA